MEKDMNNSSIVRNQAQKNILENKAKTTKFEKTNKTTSYRVLHKYTARMVPKLVSDITKFVQETLALGDKLNVPYSKKSLQIEQIVIDVECLMKNSPTEEIKIEKRNELM